MHLLERIFRCKPTDTFSNKRNLFANKSRKKNTLTQVGVLPRPLLWDLEWRILHILFIKDIFDVISRF